jgi:tetratricopeptide (TPR) repeat protein
VNSSVEGAAEVLYGLGASGTRQDEGPASLIYINLALHLNPQHVMGLVTLADVLERNKQYNAAITAYNRIPAASPVQANAELQVGFLLETAGKSEEAVKHLNAILEKKPNDLDALMALGNVYRSHKKFAESVEMYSRALATVGEDNRGHWSLYYYRGIAFERTKQWGKAEADLKKALAFVPETLRRERALVLNYLGYSWVDQNLNVEEAFKMLKQAVELQPRDGHIIDSLGWAYYRLERYEEAVRELEKAVDLRASDSVINDHLGDAYWKVGRTLEARFQWQHAKDLNPEPEDLPKILEKLEKGLNGSRANAAETEKSTPITTPPTPPKNGG